MNYPKEVETEEAEKSFDMQSEIDKWRELNDKFRASGGVGGSFFITCGVAKLSEAEQRQLVEKVMAYDDFNEDNDPYGEHNFGSIKQKGILYFWKIDYYDLNLAFRSEDPSDPNKTNRVLTILEADEY
jgi:hypothetical protein